MLWRGKWLSSRSPRWMGEQQWEVNKQVEKGKSCPFQVPRATDRFRQQWLVVIAKLLIKAGIQENRFTRWWTTKETEQRLQEPFLCVCAVLTVGWTLLESLLYSPVIVPPPAVEEQSQPFLRHRETAVHGLNINLHRQRDPGSISSWLVVCFLVASLGDCLPSFCSGCCPLRCVPGVRWAREFPLKPWECAWVWGLDVWTAIWPLDLPHINPLLCGLWFSLLCK